MNSPYDEDPCRFATWFWQKDDYCLVVFRVRTVENFLSEFLDPHLQDIKFNSSGQVISAGVDDLGTE